MTSTQPTTASPDFARRYLSGDWQKRIIAVIVLALLGVSIWSQRINRSQGFLLDDALHLQHSYERNLEISPRDYLPGVISLRPVGRDAITILLRVFGEREAPIIWTLLLIHVASSVLIWLSLYRLTSDWWASLAGATFFLLSCSAYLVIYWPAAIFDLLSTLFLAAILLSMTLILHPRGEYRPRLLLLTLPLLLAAVKSKESAIIVVAPMFLMWLISNPQRHQTETGDTRFQPGDFVQRLRRTSRWEIVWGVLTVLLAVVLYMSVVSNFGASDPADPYYSEYSPRVVGRSFGFYLAVLAFQTDENNPVRAATALALLAAPFVLAFLSRNRWLFFGWVWFVLFLLPLASFKNHYNNFYYPYPANIGTALAVAALFCIGGKLWARSSPSLARALRYALPFAFISIVAWQSYSWLKFNSVPRWYDAYHARNVRIIRGLKAALPAPPPHAKIVLVIPEATQFEQDASRVLKIIYHDFTLTGALFRERKQAEAHLSQPTSGKTLLAVWDGVRFELQDSSRR
ncbi:MAG TPA: glycosyltransferase family 39 protein [Pyrinomonadaceae bacterium]|nr:glycosyltransferase family 39 protein [Pyrinomonadaceae bacterium]